MRDALDRRLQRVRQRELRDRLADDGEQRPAALELEAGVAGSFGGAERVGGANREARKLLEPVFVRFATGREPDLQRAEHRLAELQRHDVSRSALLDGDHALLLDDRMRRSSELLVGDDRAVRAGKLECVVAEPPDERGVAARRDRCKTGDPRRRAVVRSHRGKCVTRDVERAVAVVPRCAALEPPGERRELGCERRELRLLAARRPARAARARARRRRRPRRTGP